MYLLYRVPRNFEFSFEDYYTMNNKIKQLIHKQKSLNENTQS